MNGIKRSVEGFARAQQRAPAGSKKHVFFLAQGAAGAAFYK